MSGISPRMPIPLEVLKRVTVVYTHGHCPDGMASAMVLNDAFRMLGTSPRIEFLVHGTPEHRQASRGSQEGWALWCDIAPGPEVFENPTRERCFVILDHHIGAKDIVQAFIKLIGVGAYADAEKEPGVSGAVLAFREVWEPAFLARYGDDDGRGAMRPDAMRTTVKDFVEAVGARDTGQTKSPRFMAGQYTSKMLMSHPWEDWREHSPFLHEEEVFQMGRALFEAHEHAVKQVMDQCVIYDVAPDDGRRAVMIYVFQEQTSGFRLTSDVGWTLQEKYRTNTPDDPIVVVAGFFYGLAKPGAAPRLTYSLRGPNGFDVCALAKENGGGGHAAAAGFSIGELTVHPYREICRRLGDYVREHDIGVR